ncbi:MAG: ComF family protein [Deltaproteobacteria bacterium]|nr:ComF family protein [Deltaproteobacteria bacterium]
MLDSVLDVLFPPVCPLCEEDVTDGFLCAACSKAFSEDRIVEPFCHLCGTPFLHSPGPSHTCAECLKTPPPFKQARSAYTYGTGVDEAVRAFKYHGKSILSDALGELMSGTAASFPEKPDIIMPVPLHKKRLQARGFNQSLLLARVLSKRLSVKLDYLSLKRIRHTVQQIDLKPDEREKNVAGAFEVSTGTDLRGRRVLLVDDVFTTGATIKECSKVLKRAGVEVYAVTLARAGVS